MGSPSCTVGFLFVDPIQQTYYFGTAAHCTDSADGATQDGTGTRVGTKDLGEIGTVVFDSDGPVPIDEMINGGVDFILVQLDSGVNLKANPEVLTFQGPTGYLGCTDLQAGNTVGFYGQGDLIREAGRQSRSGAVVRCNTLANKAEVGILSTGGDSGGPMLELVNGKAIGHCSSGTTPVDMNVITMDYVFRELAAAGFGNIALATIDGGFVRP